MGRIHDPGRPLSFTMNEREMADQLEEALNGALWGPRAGFESFPASSPVRELLEAAAAAREALAARPSPATKARHVVMLMDAARAGVSQVEWGPERRKRRRWVLRPILAMMVAGALALAPAMAFASNASPGDALYGAKLAIEKARLIVETETAGDVRLHLEFAAVRVSELSNLIAESHTDEIGKVMSNLAWHNRAAAAGVKKLKAAGEETGTLESAVASNLSHHVEVLTGLSEKAQCDPADPSAGDPQCKGLLNAIENSSKVLQQNNQGRGPGAETRPASEPNGAGGVAPNGKKPESPGPPVSPPGRP